MTAEQLEIFLSQNQNYKCKDDMENEFLLFRNESLQKYQHEQDYCRAIPYSDVERMNENELRHCINNGLQVIGVTRITGYFTTINRWNPGKLGELKDRRRTDLEGWLSYFSSMEEAKKDAVFMAKIRQAAQDVVSDYGKKAG